MSTKFIFAKIIDPLVEVSKGLWVYIDVNFIDKATYYTTDFVSLGSSVRSIQSGNLQTYALYIALGTAVAISFIVMG
ncbi:MAG: hypothetical protein R2827_01685 [Bdellovibrionales bacterium]